MAEEWAPGEQILLKRFDGFVRTPPLDGIRFLPFADAASSWLQFVEGDIDVAEVPVGQVEGAAETYGDQGFRPFLAGYYYGLNLDSPQLKNPKLRRAISRGIDRETIANRIYKGTMQPPRGIVPTGMPGFQENVCAKLCEYAPDAAAALVAEIPKKKRKVSIEFTKGEPHATVARTIKQNLEGIGLRVKLSSYGFKRYLRRLRDGEQSMYRLGWIAEYPTPDTFLSSLFKSTSPDNHSGFSSKKVDKLLRLAEAEPAEGRRLQLYVEAEKKILEQSPIAPIGTFVSHWAAQPNVKGLAFDVMGGFDASTVTLDG